MELRRQLDELVENASAAAAREESASSHWRRALKSARAEAETARVNAADTLARVRSELECTRSELARCMRNGEDELEAQRRNMTVAFDDALRGKEEEARKVAAVAAAALDEVLWPSCMHF